RPGGRIEISSTETSVKWLKKKARALNLTLLPFSCFHHKFLESTSLGLRHLLRERNFASWVVCDAIVPGRATGGSQDRHSSGALKARWRARFLWFCGESIGEARVRSLRLSPLTRARRLPTQRAKNHPCQNPKTHRRSRLEAAS